MARNLLYSIVVAMGMVAMSSCGGQGAPDEQATDSLSKIILADSAVANGTVKIVNDSTVRHYITITSKELPEIGRYETIKGKEYKTEIVLTIGKDMVDDITKNAIYVQEFADYLSVFVEPGNKKYCSRNGVLFTKDMTKIVWYPTNHPSSSYNVPVSVKTIGSYAFCWAKINSIKLPEGLKIIDTSAFANCFALRHIQLPASVTEIREDAFGMEYEECVDDEEWIEEHSTIAKDIDIPKDSKIEEDAISCYREEKATTTTLEISSDNPPKIGKNYHIRLKVPCDQWEIYKKMAKEIGIEEDDICCYVYCESRDR